MIKHKDWDINEVDTGKIYGGKPVMGATLQNGLNDIEPDGSFVPCDMSIEEYIGNVTTHKAKRGRYGRLSFSDNGSLNKHLCKILEKDGNGQSIKYIDSDSGLPDVSNGKPKFASDNGIIIEHTPTYKGVKIELVIADPTTAPLEYTFSIKDYGQVYDFTELGGAMIATGANGKKITYQAPYIVDADEEIGTAHYVMQGRSGGYFHFKKVVDDEAWFRGAAAPVRIDPNITIDDDTGTFEDTQTLNLSPNNNYGAWPQSALFNQPANKESTFIKVGLTLLSGVTVTDSYLGFDVFGNTYPLIGNAHVILVPWAEGTKNGTAASAGELTYNSSAHGSAAWNTANCRGDGTDRVAAVDGTYTFTANNSDTHFPVSNAAVQGMIDTPATNFGWVIETDNTVQSIKWRSSEAVTGNKPYLYIEYTAAGNPWNYYAQQMED